MIMIMIMINCVLRLMMNTGQAHTVCERDKEYLAEPGTKALDSVCEPVTECEDGKTFQATAPTGTTDRVCEAITKRCKKGEFAEVPATIYADVFCADLTECEFEEYETKAPSATSDRECTLKPTPDSGAGDDDAGGAGSQGGGSSSAGASGSSSTDDGGTDMTMVVVVVVVILLICLAVVGATLFVVKGGASASRGQPMSEQDQWDQFNAQTEWGQPAYVAARARPMPHAQGRVPRAGSSDCAPCLPGDLKHGVHGKRCLW